MNCISCWHEKKLHYSYGGCSHYDIQVVARGFRDEDEIEVKCNCKGFEEE